MQFIGNANTLATSKAHVKQVLKIKKKTHVKKCNHISKNKQTNIKQMQLPLGRVINYQHKPATNNTNDSFSTIKGALGSRQSSLTFTQFKCEHRTKAVQYPRSSEIHDADGPSRTMASTMGSGEPRPVQPHSGTNANHSY